MENKNLNKLGIDIGSTTVKIAVLGKNNELLFADYERHFANIRETLTDLLKKAFDKLGNLKLAPMITGSGGLTLALSLIHILHNYTFVLYIMQVLFSVFTLFQLICDSISLLLLIYYPFFIHKYVPFVYNYAFL